VGGREGTNTGGRDAARRTRRPGARGSERWSLGRRRLALAAALGVLGAVGFAAVALGDRDGGRPYVAGFDLADGRTAEGLTRLRQQRDIAIVVREAVCVDGGERRRVERFERVERRETSTAVMAVVRMRVKPLQEHSCAAAGVDGKRTLHLARPIGDRAVITDAGPYQFRLILIPPTGRAAVRRLVVPPHRAPKQLPAFMYFGAACDLVARYLTDLPEADWCFY
jgi:hypothetical protein